MLLYEPEEQNRKLVTAAIDLLVFNARISNTIQDSPTISGWMKSSKGKEEEKEKEKGK